MLETLLQLLPVIAGFVVGHLLRRLGLTERRDGELLFKLVFYVCAPALMFAALIRVELTRDVLILPFISAVVVTGGFAIGRVVAKGLHLTPTQHPLFLIACMIVNTGFALPFVQTIYGDEGVAALGAFDIVNATLTFTWMYAIAARANPGHRGKPILLGKLLASPPLYGIAAGLLMNVASLTPPNVVGSIAVAFGSPTGFLITLAIGMVFNPAVVHLRASVAALCVRFATTLAIGTSAVMLFDLDGTLRGVVLLICVAPIGFNTITFASIEKLDVDFASSTLSLSLVVSLVSSMTVAVMIT